MSIIHHFETESNIFDKEKHSSELH